MPKTTTNTTPAASNATGVMKDAIVPVPAGAPKRRRRLQALIGGVPQEAPKHVTASAIPPETNQGMLVSPYLLIIFFYYVLW